MQYHENILTLIGQTPLVRLSTLAEDLQALLLVKVEYFNPSLSVKDRVALAMIEEAEISGKLRLGGTIVEATSGNTGIGLALIASVKGYHCIFTISDKQSQEKIDTLRALGAEVRVCPSDVLHEDPRSYFSTAERLSKEIPNAFFPCQYDNLVNAACHYKTTAAEIWEQTDGKITHYVAGIGTGGTICGVAKYLKERNEAVRVIGVEPEGSIFAPYKATGTPRPEEVQPHYTEGIGSDFIPKNVDIDLIDEVVIVSDKDAAWTARHAAHKEGIFVGWSSGAAIAAALRYAREHLSKKDLIVATLPDHGSRYVQKIYNDDWMRSKGYWNEKEAQK